MQELQNLINKFESSFNFYILKNNYGFSNTAHDFLDRYLAIKNHMWWNDETKYANLSELLKQSMEATLTTTRSIDKINKLWIPDFNSIKKDTQYFEADVSLRSKTVCEAIQQLFENSKIRKKLSNAELYNLYGSYYQISNYIKNKTLTNETLIDIETKLRSISDKIWASSITNPNEFVSGEPFMFIVHNVSKTDMEMTNINEHSARNGRISTSLITDKEMGVYGSHKYGFIYPNNSKIITSGYKDLYSYETKKEGNYYQNNNNSMLITPQEIESYSVDKCIEVNGQNLNSDNGNIYNEVLLDTEGLKPVGIYCITHGEKELSYNYMSAKKLAENVGLPLIEIDISLYRTKDNQGTYLTDREPLTMKEQSKFAEDFLKQYYKSKGHDLATIQDFTEVDLKLYQDVIIDIFLTQKKENNIGPENLFKLFEEAKQTRKNNAENYNTYINEMSDLKEALNNFNQALSTCSNETIKNSIIEQSNEIIRRMKALNKLIENTNSIGLSANNQIYQSNVVSKEIIGNFTPFNTETIEYNGEKITIISGYKSKQELEQTKQEMLKQVDLSHDHMQKRLEHAKRVIEIKFNAYETNSTNIDFATYKKTSPELEQLKTTSHSFIDISSLDKNLTTYDELVALQQQLMTKIQNLSDNRKIYDGASSLEWLEQNQKESATKIENYKNSITSNEQELISLCQRQDELLREKAELDKKGFVGKMFTNKIINENETKLSDLKRQIERLEHEVNTMKDSMVYEEKYIKQITDNFLSMFGLNGMSLEDYKKKLETIIPNAEKLTDPFMQKELEEKLKIVEQKIAKMQINKQKEQQMRQILEQKKIGVGLSTPQPIITEIPEEFEADKKAGISR